MAYIFFDLKNLDIHIPIQCYGYSDAVSFSYRVKSMLETGWVFENNSVGMPLGANFYDIPSTEVFILFAIKLLAQITGHYGIAINCWYVFTFSLTTMVSYCCMRRLKIESLWAILGSITYAFLPYHFLRTTMHLMLSTYSFIPIAIVILIEIFLDDDFYIIDKNFFKYKKNLYAVMGLMLISITGFYYAFFICFLIVLMGMSKILKSKKIWKNLKQMGVMILNIVIPLFMTMIPNIIMKAKMGVNADAPIRNVADAEIYGMKLVRLFLPTDPKTDIGQKIIDKYADASLQISTEMSEYLGIIGIIGFIVLISLLFMKSNFLTHLEKKLTILKEMNLGLILLGTIGGFGSLFALLISPQIRAYNRVSIIIAYLCLLTVCLLLSTYIKNKKDIATYIVVIAICAFGLWEQKCSVPDHALSKMVYYSDEEFVKEIEATVPEGSMIYQLPYHKYPEEPNRNNMKEYSLFRGYLHSDTLKWSYGGYKGRDSDLWNRYVASQSLDDMIDTIVTAGFKGIYIDRDAYTEQDINSLESKLINILQVQPIYSREENVDQSWNWMQQYAKIEIENLLDEEINIHLIMNLYSGDAEDSQVIMSLNGEAWSHNIKAGGQTIEQVIKLVPGRNTITFGTDANQIETIGDSRVLYLRIIQPKIEIILE